MLERKLVIEEKGGLHLRPALLFVDIVKRSNSKVVLSYKGKNVCGENLLGILKLGIEYGESIFIKIEGTDEEKVLNILTGEFSPQKVSNKK